MIVRCGFFFGSSDGYRFRKLLRLILLGETLFACAASGRERQQLPQGGFEET